MSIAVARALRVVKGCPRGQLLARSNDGIVFSISSAAMSDVDWMPWIFSLNSSGLSTSSGRSR